MVVLYLLLVLIAMEIIGVQLVRRLQNYYDDNFRTTLETQANLLASFAARYFTGEQSEAYLGDLVDDFRLQTGAEIVVVDAGGMLLAAGGAQRGQLGKRFQQPHIIRALSGVSTTEVRREDNKKARTLDLAVPVQRGHEVVGAVGFSSSLAEVDHTLTEIKAIFLTATLTALMATAALGFALARTITRPIQEVTNQAKAIASGDFGEPVTVHSQDEVGQLAAMFNYLRQRLRENLTALSQEKEKVEAVLANLSDGVVALDAAGSIVLVNPAALGLLESDQKIHDLIGRPFAEAFPELDLKPAPAQTRAENTIVQFEDKYGHKRVLRVHMAAFKTGPAEPGLVITFQDITDEERLESMRRDFVANVSHELRTPLTTAKSYVETILDQDETLAPQLRRRFLTVVNDEVDRMARLVRDLLQLAQLDAGRIKIKKQAIHLPALVENVIERFRVQAQRSRLALTLTADESVPPVAADKDRLDQVLANLIGNAVKFTAPGGRIKITVGPAAGGQIKTTVADSGSGIPAEDQPRIFERFYRVDKARSRSQGGTGLGLSIAKQIIEAHGGHIWLTSTVGKGTEVSFTLPVSPESRDQDDF